MPWEPVARPEPKRKMQGKRQREKRDLVAYRWGANNMLRAGHDLVSVLQWLWKRLYAKGRQEEYRRLAREMMVEHEVMGMRR
ncbi:MAG: hypothetical protein QME75_10620 [Deltaproteobacteria bacterium]|nr:hypothetical protein [Deltaproteobacteria bacterium]